MSNELQYHGLTTQTGLTVVAKIYDATGTQIGGDVSCSEVDSTALYLGNMPSIAAGSYTVKFYQSSTLLGYGQIYWDGSNEIDNVKLNTNIITAIKRASFAASINA